tara:strand:- start:270 stop:575 length:306 start_codon:yes stop_codon:yes gene_type:complete
VCKRGLVLLSSQYPEFNQKKKLEDKEAALIKLLQNFTKSCGKKIKYAKIKDKNITTKKEGNSLLALLIKNSEKLNLFSSSLLKINDVIKKPLITIKTSTPK